MILDLSILKARMICTKSTISQVPDLSDQDHSWPSSDQRAREVFCCGQRQTRRDNTLNGRVLSVQRGDDGDDLNVFNISTYDQGMACISYHYVYTSYKYMCMYIYIYIYIITSNRLRYIVHIWTFLQGILRVFAKNFRTEAQALAKFMKSTTFSMEPFLRSKKPCSLRASPEVLEHVGSCR